MWKSIENCILISENKIQNWKYKIQNNIIKYYFAVLFYNLFCLPYFSSAIANIFCPLCSLPSIKHSIFAFKMNKV